jgi:hypothetical protein
MNFVSGADDSGILKKVSAEILLQKQPALLHKDGPQLDK